MYHYSDVHVTVDLNVYMDVDVKSSELELSHVNAKVRERIHTNISMDVFI